MMLKRHHLVLLITTFIAVQIAIMTITDRLAQEKVQGIIDKKNDVFYSAYQSILQGYSRLSSLLFDATIERPEVIEILRRALHSKGPIRQIERRRLHDLLRDDYEHLKALNLRQLHFHLPNNESFLRFHKPSKFGDDLTFVRESVRLTNTRMKKYEGFEEGRIYNGFRHVFPIIDSLGEHLGSVETSLSFHALKKDLEKTFAGEIQFMISRRLVEEKVWKSEQSHYQLSDLSDHFFFENRMVISGTSSLNSHIKERIKPLLKTQKPFGIATEYDGHHYIVSFLPIPNVEGIQDAAYLIAYIRSNVLKTILDEYDFIMYIFTLLNIIGFLSLGALIHANSRLNKTSKELIELNRDLEERIKEETEKRSEKEKMLIHQSKMAEMGEMIGVIAHQWKQPVNTIALLTDELMMDYEEDLLDDQHIERFQNNIHERLNFMAKTIDNFRNFYKPNKEKELFNIEQTINKSIDIIRPQLKKRAIEITITHNNQMIEGIEGELQQVILNLVNNAKDALLTNNTQNPMIEIAVNDHHHDVVITVEDNAGGVPDDHLPNIFEPYFSTKGKNGTGIGLYMVRLIVLESMEGSIRVTNTQKGAKFIITLPSKPL